MQNGKCKRQGRSGVGADLCVRPSMGCERITLGGSPPATDFVYIARIFIRVRCFSWNPNPILIWNSMPF